MSEALSTYFQQNGPLDPSVQLFTIENFPKTPQAYRAQNARDDLHPLLKVTIPITRILTKKELYAEEMYVKQLRDWTKTIVQKIQDRHTKELDRAQKQLQELVNQTHARQMGMKEVEQFGKNICA